MALQWRIVLAAVIVASVSAAHAGKLYKWVDKDGNVSYHDQPPMSDGYRVEEKQVGERTSRQSNEAAERAPVVLYTASKCASCDTARAYLKARGVPFAEKNVEGDRKLQDELIKQAGGLAVPTIMVGAKIMKGYLESLLEGELDQAGYPKAESEEAQKPSS